MKFFRHLQKTVFLCVLLSAPLMLFAQEASVEKLPEVYRSFYRIGFGVPKKITPAPDFTLKDLSGRDVTLSELEGKVVLLNLWATWCPPCRAEMPSMQELYDMFPRDEFTILAVAAPNTSRDSREKIEQHIEENEFSFPVLLDEDMEVNAAYGSGSIPTSWIVGPDGNLIARLIGARDWTEEAIVDALRELMET